MKTIVYLIIIMACNISVSQAQTYKISQLAGTKWILCLGDTSRVKRVWDFSDKTLKTSTLFKSINKSNNFTYNYYLSVSPTETFSSGLIGKGTTGGILSFRRRME